MVRTVDYESRRRAILAATINRYIRDAVPVASEDIAQYFDLSPATIRNIFAELEEANYLTHPYTSGGRVPTNKGYRYYVDHLMNEIQLLEEEKRRISQEYKHHARQLEDLMETTSQVISDLTHYTSIVSLDDGDDYRIVCKGTSYVVDYPEQTDILKIRSILPLACGELAWIINTSSSLRALSNWLSGLILLRSSSIEALPGDLYVVCLSKYTLKGMPRFLM